VTRDTNTRTGLEIYAQLDERSYPKSVVSDEHLAAVDLHGHDFHPNGTTPSSPT